MNKLSIFTLLILSTLFLNITLSLAHDPSSTLSSVVSSSEKPEKIVPPDAALALSDFNIVLRSLSSEFSEWIFPILIDDSFTEIKETTMLSDRYALSDHYINWSEVGIFLTSVGGLSALQPLLPEQMFTDFFQKVMDHLSIKEGVYVAQEEFSNEPATLPYLLFQCYANWREVRYYLFKQLVKQEEIYEQGLNETVKIPDELTTYFESQKLLPLAQVFPEMYHLAEALAKSPGIGTYWFSKERGVIERVSDYNPYRLATLKEMIAWPLNDNDPAKLASPDHEGYARLAINVTKMEHCPGFKKQEDKSREAQKDQCSRLKASNQQQAQNNKNSDEKTKSIVAPIMYGLGLIADIGSAFFCIGSECGVLFLKVAPSITKEEIYKEITLTAGRLGQKEAVQAELRLCGDGFEKNELRRMEDKSYEDWNENAYGNSRYQDQDYVVNTNFTTWQSSESFEAFNTLKKRVQIERQREIGAELFGGSMLLEGLGALIDTP